MAAAVQGYVQSRVYMDTTVTVELSEPAASTMQSMERAFGWFREVEARCSRFEAASELRGLCSRAGEPVEVSPLLFRCIEFALAVAAATDGAFDPTVGGTMMRRGFDRSYRSGEMTDEAVTAGSYQDVVLDCSRQAVTLLRPLLLDLGAVAKGLAIDLAAAELEHEAGFLINAGGDIRAGGVGPSGAPWLVGIRDANQPSRILEAIQLADGAVCSSGGYERPARSGGHHIVRPGDGQSPEAIAGVTVIAPLAMVADALSTAAFVLGVEAGIELLERSGVEGRIVTRTGLVVSTETSGRCGS